MGKTTAVVALAVGLLGAPLALAQTPGGDPRIAALECQAAQAGNASLQLEAQAMQLRLQAAERQVQGLEKALAEAKAARPSYAEWAREHMAPGKGKAEGKGKKK
jgi:hypothetical protein